MNTLVTKRFKDPRTWDRQFTDRPSHTLQVKTAVQWVKDDVLGNHFSIGASAYDRWKFTLEAWVDQRIKDGHLTAAALIIELLNAGQICRAYGTPQAVDMVARLWVRCHNEAGVECEACK